MKTTPKTRGKKPRISDKEIKATFEILESIKNFNPKNNMENFIPNFKPSKVTPPQYLPMKDKGESLTGVFVSHGFISGFNGDDGTPIALTVFFDGKQYITTPKRVQFKNMGANCVGKLYRITNTGKSQLDGGRTFNTFSIEEHEGELPSSLLDFDKNILVAWGESEIHPDF